MVGYAPARVDCGDAPVVCPFFSLLYELPFEFGALHRHDELVTLLANDLAETLAEADTN